MSGLGGGAAHGEWDGTEDGEEGHRLREEED